MNQTTNQKILVVEDSLDSQLIIRSALGADYHLRMVGSSTDARNVLAEEMYDLLILDIRLPDGSGQEICRELQSDPKYKHMPIIFLTSKTATEDKVQGFEVGADDYITKPFEPDELRARVQARLRKLKQIRDASDSMVVQNFHIDLTGNQVSFKLTDGSEQKLDLTPNEFKIFAFLGRNFGEVLERDRMIQDLWGGDSEISVRTVDAHVSNLRKKIQPGGLNIKSIRGVGYLLSEA